MYTVEYAFSSTHDIDDAFWERETADNLDIAADTIARINPQDWEVFDEEGRDCSQSIITLIRQRKRERTSHRHGKH